MKEMWNERYQGNPSFYGDIPNDFLKASYHLLTPRGKILCLAEGQGRNAIFLATQGFEVTAVDFSEVGIKCIQEKAKQLKLPIKTVLQDIREFKFEPDSWDGIVSIFAHFPPTIRKEVYPKIPDSLKKGGIFICEAYRPEQLDYKTGGPSQKDWLMNLALLNQELSTLKPLFMMETDRMIQEGSHHHGLSSVVQFIAQKI